MEGARSTTPIGGGRLWERVSDDPAQRARIGLIGFLVVLVLVLVAFEGLHEVAQRSVNGLSNGSIFALGAVGLTLVYGILKLVNFAHGDFLTFGAYAAYIVNVSWGGPLILGILFAILATALLGVALEKVMWGPMRARGAGQLQLLLMAIGLAFVIRYGIQFVPQVNGSGITWDVPAFGTELLQYDINRSAAVEFLGLRVGEIQLVVILVGFVVLIATGLMLKLTTLGKRMRALSDNIDLAETTGIDTSRVILWTWIFAAGLAGLAGVFAGAITQLQPELGFEFLLPIFAAVVLGGIGNAFGALIAGVLLGVVIEWSTFIPGVDSGAKLAVGFVVLIIVLVIRPQGILGQARTV